MQKRRTDMGMARDGVALAAGLVLALASYCVAADGQPAKKPAGTQVSPRTSEVGEMLYGGGGGGAWGSPSRTAARLARQREIEEQAMKVRVREFEKPVGLAAPVAEPPRGLPVTPALAAPDDAGRMAQWLIPLGGGIVIGLGVAGIYALNRSRGMARSASGQLLVVSAVRSTGPVLASLVPAGSSPSQMGAIPNLPRRRAGRSARSIQLRIMNFPKLRIRPGRDLQGDAIRQLEMLGVLPSQLHAMSPGTGRPSWFANAVSDEVQMYGGGSDPIPNYAYIEDAPRMLAQVEHQKAAEAMVWSNQHWQR